MSDECVHVKLYLESSIEDKSSALEWKCAKCSHKEHETIEVVYLVTRDDLIRTNEEE